MIMCAESENIKQNEKTISIVFIDGCYSAEKSNILALPSNIVFCPFSLVVNWLRGVFIYIPKNTVVTAPIHIIFQNTGTVQKDCYLRNTIVLEENSQLTLIEEYTGINNAAEYLINSATEIQLNKNAVFHYYKLQSVANNATYKANLLIQQDEASYAKVFFADHGAKTADTNVRINLHAKQAHSELSGLYQLKHDEQQINNHVYIDHAAPHSKSVMQFKGILDKRSKANFIGKVYVHEQAQHINAEQKNHNLLLSTHAEVSTKPELEIYADDVKCSHGATVGQLDEDAVFYLQSRGIEKQDALQILTQAFAEDMLNKMHHPAIRQYIQERMNHA